MTVAIGLGSRFPAYQTSLGRVLLAELDDETVIELYSRSDTSRTTERTVTSAEALVEKLGQVRRCGYAVVDQELEIGVRSVAAPLRDGNGRALAAVNVSTHAGRTTLDQVHETFVPALLQTAADISSALARR